MLFYEIACSMIGYTIVVRNGVIFMIFIPQNAHAYAVQTKIQNIKGKQLRYALIFIIL